MTHRRHHFLLVGLYLGSWVRMGFLALGLVLGLGPMGLAQTVPPIVIPIVKERVRYYSLSEDGSRIQCGIRLYGSFPVYKGRTNLNDYRIFIPGVQNPGSWRLEADGRFRFYAYFNGTDAPASRDPDCNHTIGESLPDWHAEYQPKRPLASFTATSVASVPGEWDFLSTSTDAEDQPLIEQWVFGDGTDGSGKKVSHRYTKPGRFTTYLTVTDTDGLTNRNLRNIDVPAPKPVVSIQLFNKHSGNRIELEETFRVRVTVQATTDGIGALSNLVFTGPPLSIPNLFTNLSGPGQTNIGTLQPGDPPREFNWTLKAIQAGQFALTTSGVRGQDAIGRTVTGAGKAAEGQVTALIVGIEQRPKQVVLEGDNNGDGKTNSLDKLVQIIVSVTNVINVAITNVQTTVTNDPISLISLASTPNINMIATNTVPGVFGTIPPGESRSITNTYEAWGRVYAEAQSVVHGKADGVPVDAAGKGTINVGGATLLELRLAIREDKHEAGKPIRVFGSITNVSLLKSREGNVVDEGKTVGVVVYSFPEGNGIGGFLSDVRSGGKTPRAPSPFLLKPGESIEVSAILPTAEMPTNTWVFLNYAAVGFVHENGQKRDAFPYEIKFVEESIGDDVNQRFSATHRVELPPAPEIIDPWEECSLDFPTDAYYSCRVRNGLGTLFGGPRDLIMLAGSGLWEIGKGTPRMSAYFLWTEEQRIKALLGDEKARERLATQIDLDWQALRAVGADILPDSTTPGTILSAVDRSLSKFANRKGGFRYWAGGALELLVENADMAGELWIAARTYKELSLEAAESAAKKAQADYFQKQADELAGKVDEFAARRSLSELPKSGILPFGLDVFKHPKIWRDAYGATEREIKALMEIARKEGVIIAFRSRAPRAAELIEKGLALLKPHGVSIKTVSEIDHKYLFYPKKYEGLCVLVDPPFPWDPPWIPAGADRDALMKGFLRRHHPELEADEDLFAEVLQRLEERLEEYPKEKKNFDLYRERGTIDVGFATQKQFGNNPLFKDVIVNNGNFRKAEIISEPVEDALSGEIQRKARVLTMETGRGSGKFLPITGDIDLLGIFNLDGTAPGIFKRLRLYKHLRKAGIQHGESFTFFKETARALFLSCCSSITEGAETMLAVTPFGQLVPTRFSEGLSVLPGGVNASLQVGKHVDDQFTYLEGVMTEAVSKERPSIGDYFEALRYDVAPHATVSAVGKLVDNEDAEIDRRNGLAFRVGADGLPEIYTLPGTNPSVTNAQRLSGSSTTPVRLLRQQSSAVDDVDAMVAKPAAAGYVPEPPAPGLLGGSWHRATAEEITAAKAGPTVKIAPYTYLYDDIPIGATVLPVFSAAELGAKPNSQFFAVGDTIAIDPGGPNEETAILVSVSPLTVSRPLESAKYVGTTVLFLSGLTDAGQLPGALPAQENLLVWLRADAGLSLTNGTNVISWTDQSRNGFVFRAPSAATRPEWVTDSAPGVPAVRFNSGSTPRLQGNLGRTLTNATIFTVARYLNNSTGSRYIYAFGTINFSGLMMTLGRNNGDNALHYDGAVGRTAPNAIPGIGFQLFSQVYGGDRPDSHQLAVDGHTLIESRTTVGRAYSAVATNVVLGKYVNGAFGFTGDLAEWIVYDRALSTAERFEVEAYLRQRAQLASVVPDGSSDVSSSEILDYDVSAAPAAAWSLDLGDRQLKQAGTGDPSLALSGSTESGQVIRTKIRGSAGSGALGVVFGYQHRGQFHLFDWRQTAGTDADWGTAPAGMRLRSFQLPVGTEPTGADFWSGLDRNRVTTWRTNALPWVADREYEVVLRFGGNETVVEVNFGISNLETWTVPELKGISGQFGHYANSLPGACFGPVLLPGRVPLITGIEPRDAGDWTVRWLNGVSPFVLESTTDLLSGSWNPVAPATLNYSRTVPALGETQLFRVRSLGVVPDSSGAGGSGQSQTFGNDGKLWLIRRAAPTRIEAENFDTGGQGVAYQDSNAQNSGGLYREEGVDVYATVDAGGGHGVGWIAAGEWLDYTIRVEAAGTYKLRARTARGTGTNRTVRFLVEGRDMTGNLVVPRTANWNTYATVESGTFELTAGPKILRAEMTSGDFNLNWFEIVPVE